MSKLFSTFLAYEGGMWNARISHKMLDCIPDLSHYRTTNVEILAASIPMLAARIPTFIDTTVKP